MVLCQVTKCKYCGKESENVHSTYTRVISDLPIQNYKVKLIIKVKKYFCNNDKCQHTTFAEPLDFVEKNAINEALPKAKQIVDRFHILKNLTDDLNEYIKRNIKETIKMIDTKGKAVIEEEIILNRRQRNKKESAEKKWEVIQEVQKLYKEGYNKSAIAKKLKISRQTIYTYLNQKQPLERSTHSILDSYIPMIKKLILEGKKVFEIYDEIKANGYKGKTSLFTSRLRGIRQEARTNIKYLKRSKIKKLLFYDIEEIKDENLKNDLKEYLETDKELNELINIIRKFKEVIFSKKPRKLAKWIREAKKLM